MSNKRHAQYREAAVRIMKNIVDVYFDRYFVEVGPVKVSPTAHVHELSDGAFVEVSVWIPKAQADEESGESNELSLPQKI